MKAFADEKGLLRGSSGFGIDAVVWIMGTQGSVMMAMDAPEAFGQLIDTIAETDYARTELAARTDGVDLVCQRGWYSSTDFWSPRLFDRVCLSASCRTGGAGPSTREEFGYVMTTGVERLGPDWPTRAWPCSTSSIRCWMASRWRRRESCSATA